MKLVIFDVDGTLVDSQAMILAALHRAFDDIGFPRPERANALSVVGLSLPEAFTVLGEGHDAFPVEKAASAYKAAYQALRRESDHVEPLFPGAEAAVERLAARDDVILALATGKSRRGVDVVLGRHGLLRHFASVQTADNHPSKPHPSMVMQAMRDTGVAPEATVMIGDTTFDIAMGQAAGARTVAVSWGYHSLNDLKALRPDADIHAFDALDGALARLFDETCAIS
jgi:phosphoglycolate phosphatase